MTNNPGSPPFGNTDLTGLRSVLKRKFPGDRIVVSWKVGRS